MTGREGPIDAALERENAALREEVSELRRDLSEAAARQAATSEVLSAISTSPGELAPVFDTILANAVQLCEAEMGHVYRVDGETITPAATHGSPPEFHERMLARGAWRPDPRNGVAEAIRLKCPVQVEDLSKHPLYAESNVNIVPMVESYGLRSLLHVPMLKAGKVIGVIVLYRREVRPFIQNHIDLVDNFADQAVIAIENARLLSELHESLERRTATAEVLAVISSSPGEVQPVFETMLQNAVRLCDAGNGSIFIASDDVLRRVANLGLTGDISGHNEIPLTPGTHPARMRDTLKSVHVPDFLAALEEMSVQHGNEPSVEAGQAVAQQGVRSVLWVPMVKDSALVGAFVLNRLEPRPFTEAQISLVETFASQAVIAIENARLLEELRDRNKDLSQSLEQQTATSEILRAIAGTPGDADHVLDTITATAYRLFDAYGAAITRVDHGIFGEVAAKGAPAGMLQNIRGHHVTRGTVAGRAILEKRTVHIENIGQRSDEFHTSAAAVSEGIGTIVATPLLREGEVIGTISVTRSSVRPFTEKEIELLASFADQAVIAIENARLLEELRTARDTAETALDNLKTAQASLIQAEKMASLGQLTAGIAHEIKNPLNFVNNFAGLSVELLDEFKATTAPALAMLDMDARADVDEVIEMLTGNLQKVAEHGKRADGIVKSMLAHSRSGGGEWQAVDLNKLVEEALNLAYHGARAQDQDFNITLERDLDPSLHALEVVPQDLTRVFLNLFGNGFYAATKRLKERGEPEFQPILKVSTQDLGAEVAIRIRDNGVGIPPENRPRLFEPFFTTKPTGEGTGLGLSISYDIVTQQHGGAITVESEPGAFTEFTIALPRRTAPAAGVERSMAE